MTIATTAQAPAPHRDNLFGVCHALGETFGFDPLVLRLALMLGLLLDFEAALAAYVACGVAVAAAALVTRRPAPAAPETGSASSCR